MARAQGIIAAARRTLATPASKELVGLGAHRISTVQQPAVGILLDGRRVHTLQLGVSIIFDVTRHGGRGQRRPLSAVHSGRCDVGVALTIHDVEVLTKRHTSMVKAVGSGVRLARRVPDTGAACDPTRLTFGGPVGKNLDVVDGQGDADIAPPE